MTKAEKLGITKFPYIELDELGRIIYKEIECGEYCEYRYNQFNQLIYYKNFGGEGFVEEFDSNGNSIFYMELKTWNKIKNREKIIEKILNDF